MPLVQNSLIEHLPRAAKARFLALCTPFPLVLSQVLCAAGDLTRYAYFPTQGFVSLVAVVVGSPGVAVAMVGREGMVGSHLALQVARQPLHALVQGAGSAMRIAARAFRAELGRSAALRTSMKHYLYVSMAQMAAGSACVRFHEVGPRLARWLLMSQDRARSDRFPITQESLAYMLGVRRAGISDAAGDLKRRGLITYRRGDVVVLDRAGLELEACSCYRSSESLHADHMP